MEFARKGPLAPVVPLLVIAASAAAGFRAPLARADGLRPAADAHCQLSDSDRASRIRYVDRKLESIDHDLTVARDALKTFQDSLEDMNDAQTAGNICLGISMVAGAIAGVGAVYEVFFSGEAVTFFGISSQTVLRTITAAGAASRAVSIPAGIVFLLHEHPVYANEVQQIQQQQAGAVEGKPLISESAARFLSDPSCSGPDCVTDQPQIEQAFDNLKAWHDEAERHLEETDGHWYNPFSWEWHSHHFALSLAEVEIPWAANTIDLLDMRRAYYQLLKAILVNDRDACAARDYSM